LNDHDVARQLELELDAEAINWDNIRALLAALMQQFGPILMQILLAWLTKAPASK
jgi:hypothetical protein